MASEKVKECKRDISKKISFHLKECREARGLSYAELSRLSGISKSTLQRYETGATVTIPIDKVSALEEALNLKAGFLMGWTQKEKPQKQPQKGYFFEEANVQFEEGNDDWALLTHKPIFDLLRKKEAEANFLIVAPDNSMEKSGIKKGATVFINTAFIPENGEIGAITINNTPFVCHIKKDSGTWCFYTGDANVIKFSSDLKGDNISICGKAAAVLNIL